MMNRRYVKNEWGVTIDYEVAENLMDDELREKIAYELQLVSDQEFFDSTSRSTKKFLVKNGSLQRKTRVIKGVGKMKRTKRKCPECGTEFFGTTGSTLCPACQKSKIANSTIRERTCIDCGRTFDGGPRAKRCPECRILARKENTAKYHKSGPMRPLGSIDYCQRCGKEYVVKTGRQKYCSDKCAQISVKEWQSEHKKAKYSPEEAKKQRTESRSKKIKICRYCGKSFWDGASSNVCSEYCRKKQLQIRRYEADIRRGYNCDLQKLLDERELYRKEQKKRVTNNER